MAHLGLTGDFPMPNRADLMSLQTISAKQDQVKQTTAKFSTMRNASNNLATTDIQGAAPKLHGSKQTKKQEFTNSNWDIDRSGPRALHIGLYKEETNLRASDIEGAQPNINKFKSTRQGNDPLNPSYQLSKVEVRPVTPPKFIRDAMNIDDIDKCKPKADTMAGRKTRDVMAIDDIAGTRAIQRHKPRATSTFNAIDYTDVTKMERKSKRCSNPLDPTYMHTDDDGKMFEIGAVDGSKPAKMPDVPKDKSIYGGSLNSKDIAGAQTSTKGLGVFANVTRRTDQMQSNSLDTKAVFGAQSGTLLKGPKTKRVGNPLDGSYQYPGHSELTDKNNPYSITKKEDIAKKTAQSTFAKTGAQQMGISNKNPVTGGLQELPEHKQKAMMESYNAFYGTDNDAKAAKLSYNKLYQASREQAGNKDPMQAVPSNMRQDAAFKQAQKRFFQNEVSDTASQYNLNAGKFFDNPSQAGGRPDPAKTLGTTFQGVQDRVVPSNMDGERYKRDTAAFVGDEVEARSNGSIFNANKAAFYGEEKPKPGFKIAPTKGVQGQQPTMNTKSGLYKKDEANFYGNDKFEVESQGTQFQQNAAAFMGTDQPKTGERPFKLDKNAEGSNNHSQIKGKSFLNEQRLREHELNMQRDPSFKKNERRFLGLNTNVTRSNGPVSTANRLDAFIGN